MRSILRSVLLSLAATLVATTAGVPHASAQETAAVPAFQGDSSLVDQVAAIVGDSVILASEVAVQVQVARSQGQNVSPDEILDQLVNLQLILQAAATDTTLVVDEQDLSARVDAAVEEIRANFGSESAYQRALEQQGLTPASHREELRERLRIDQIRQMYIQRQLRDAPPVAVTDAEMRRFFDARRESLQERPELLTIRQVLLEPTASDSAWARAVAVADSLRAELVAGADFAELAREHSDDPGSAAQGGDLGWFRRGVMVREFEQVAFRLPNDRISPPVRTPFGYHLIKVERSRPGEVKARHILIRPEVTPEDESRARARGEEVARRARAGESMLELFEEFSPDEDQPEEFTISRAEASQIPYPGYNEALTGAAEGDVVGPFRSQIEGASYIVVLKLQDIREAGEFTYEDVREQIRQTLLQQKRMDRIFDRLRESTYVDVRM